jgi:hypothetical protein
MMDAARLSRKMLCALLLLGASADEVRAGWFSYDNYEDCLLGRMKGQSQPMYFAADKSCKREFKVEFEIGLGGVEWAFVSGPEGLLIRLQKAPDEYEITQAKFEFAKGPCEGKTEADFGKARVLQFKRGDALILDPDLDNGPVCARAISFRGRYK